MLFQYWKDLFPENWYSKVGKSLKTLRPQDFPTLLFQLVLFKDQHKKFIKDRLEPQSHRKLFCLKLSNGRGSSVLFLEIFKSDIFKIELSPFVNIDSNFPANISVKTVFLHYEDIDLLKHLYKSALGLK